MTKLETLHSQIVKEQRRIIMLKNTTAICPDFLKEETKEARQKIDILQKEFEQEYEYQQS